MLVLLEWEMALQELSSSPSHWGNIIVTNPCYRPNFQIPFNSRR